MFPARPRSRSRSRAGERPGARAHVPLLALAALALAAGPAGAAGPHPVRPAPRDRLVVTVDDGGGSTATTTLRCHPSGGTHPAARAACLRLDRLGGPLGPVPPARLCTMIFAGPQVARVTGRWRGRRVDRTYRRSNGCEVQRWEAMEPVLPDPAAHRAPAGSPLAGSGPLAVR